MGIRSLNAMKCFYVGFSPSKQQSFFRKISFNSCLMGFDQLYTGRAGVGKVFKNKIRNLSRCVPRGLVVTIQAARRITGGTCSS